MAEDAAVEGLLARCVEAGVAARRAHDTATESRRQANLRGALTADDVEHLNKLEAAAERLSRGFLDEQRRLAEANRVRFRERLEAITHRINERLR